MASFPRPVWDAAAAILFTAAVLAVGVWSGGCSRFGEAPLRCWAGPSLGWPVAIPVAVVCASLAVLCLRRALRGRAARAARTDPGDGDRAAADPTPGRDA
ncbi:hypothetical protein FGG90_12295 [Clavibacter tessellarius]|uniref:Uncharacterized protein n=1 Tax=Clavibacter tessellarius TaxID=31965 RepID=A0A225CIT4_9MICO|nr:hypothetical protein [Clavibacter michiganensis]OQJ62303.1 hypothetical protein B5P24_04410 [Clavibacter michiganensis subsp. tessellarius]UKF34697.1 hypothetical protein FGG90_12295 [Clavibacter michiganensis subsp. tessellarius]